MDAMIAILLAGGRSARVGIDKATLQLNGETLVERHLRQLRIAGVLGALIVCNAENQESIRARTAARTSLQRGNSMSAAVLTGIEEARSEAVFLICVNDIIDDDGYRAIVSMEHRAETIVIPTRPIERRFPGGYLDLDSATGAVRRIVERPYGGCPVGAAANIMIHRIEGRSLQERIAALLRNGIEYEAAVNELIREGVPVRTAPIHSWVAIKTPDDIARAQAAVFNRSRDAVHGSSP
jgi:molybdopterin-guanine dinucleotide biosynthesis protein A